MLTLYILFYVLITFALSLAGIEKQNQGIRLFFISVLLTPLAGYIYLINQRKKVSNVRYYYCSECDYIFPHKMKNCPICEEKGMKVRLVKYVSPYEFQRKIKLVQLD
jgi:uncharacterized membrane protein